MINHRAGMACTNHVKLQLISLSIETVRNCCVRTLIINKMLCVIDMQIGKHHNIGAQLNRRLITSYIYAFTPKTSSMTVYINYFQMIMAVVAYRMPVDLSLLIQHRPADGSSVTETVSVTTSQLQDDTGNEYSSPVRWILFEPRQDNM